MKVGAGMAGRVHVRSDILATTKELACKLYLYSTNLPTMYHRLHGSGSIRYATKMQTCRLHAGILHLLSLWVSLPYSACRSLYHFLCRTCDSLMEIVCVLVLLLIVGFFSSAICFGDYPL